MNDKKKLINDLKIVSDKLKSEFVGIDQTIDDLIESITPWYVTPELIKRPIVVSLWGLTGTGKTSVVRRLLAHLDLESKTLFFDCGSEENNEDSIADKVSNFFGDSNHDASDKARSNVFVFDEFQYARTLDEDGREISKSPQRSMWSIIDSGIIDYVYRPYETKELLTYTEELKYIFDSIGIDTRITNGEWPSNINKQTRDSIEFYKTWDERNDDNKDDKSILSKYKREILISKLNHITPGSGYSVINSLLSSKTLGEYLTNLEKGVKLISKPRQINFSNSLVFIIGNLDEAFIDYDNLDPDMDADVFAKIVKKVDIISIKEALKNRFRVEQIGRLGNNMIIYPSLDKNSFKEIINRELNRVSEEYKAETGISLEFKDSFKDLIYVEGVYPSQGVRPVYTTINTVCLPKFSKILSDPRPKETVSFEAIGNLRSESVNIVMTYDTGEILIVEEKLNLGKIRDKSSCKKLAAHAIHEAGHAILISREKGEIPDLILAQSSLGGGYTYEKQDNSDKLSAMCKKEVRAIVRIALAGNCAEHLFFDDDHCTIGCSEDYRSAWRQLSQAAYHGGFFNTPYPINCLNTSDGISEGVRDDTGLYGNNNLSIMDKMLADYMKIEDDATTNILKEEITLLKEIAKYLVENYSMFPNEYKKFVEKYGSKKIKESLDPSNNDDSYWLDKLN